jgi:hypothetical protein
MTPDQRTDGQEFSQNQKLSYMIKGSIQQTEPPREAGSPMQPTARETKQEFQQSKVTKDSLVYSLGDDEKATLLQKSALSGSSEEQLSAYLNSKENVLVKQTFSNASANIHIEDFSRSHDLGKLIIQESTPRQENNMETGFMPAASIKKSSKRLSSNEASDYFLAVDAKPALEPAHHQLKPSVASIPNSLPPRPPIATRVDSIKQPIIQKLPLAQISTNPEQYIQHVPMTAVMSTNTMRSDSQHMIVSTGNSTPNETPQRSDRLATQEYHPQVQHTIQPSQTSIKPGTSSLLANRQTGLSTTPTISGTVSQRVSSSTGTQFSKSAVANRAQPSEEQTAQSGKHIGNQGQVLALRTAREQLSVPEQLQEGQPIWMTRTITATPEVIEYVKSHQGQFPQDTVITHPAKVVAQYTLDAEGKKIFLANQELQKESSTIANQYQNSAQKASLITRVSERPASQSKPTVSQQTTNQPQHVQPAVTKQHEERPVTNHRQERMHKIDDEVIIENKPYIIDPNTGKKIYVDPNNLSAYLPLFKQSPGQGQQPHKGDLHVAQASERRAEPRQSSKTTLSSGENQHQAHESQKGDHTTSHLSPQTQVIRVPKSAGVSSTAEQPRSGADVTVTTHSKHGRSGLNQELIIR